MRQHGGFCFFFFAFVCQYFICPYRLRDTEASAAANTGTTQEHKSSSSCLFEAAPGLLSVIEKSKERERRFVPQSVSFVGVDMKEGMKQWDEKALMCLKNLLFIIKAHTHMHHIAKKEQTQILASVCRVTLCSRPGSIHLGLKCHSLRLLASSFKDWTTGFKAKWQSATLFCPSSRSENVFVNIRYNR